MSFDTQWLDWATALQDRQNRLFWDEKGGAYFTTSGKDPNLLLKTKGDFDGAEPSPPLSGQAFHARIGDELSRGHGKSKNCR